MTKRGREKKIDRFQIKFDKNFSKTMPCKYFIYGNIN